MTKSMNLSNKTNLATLRAEIEDALGKVGARHGLEFDLGNCKYDGSGKRCHFVKAIFSQIGESEAADDWSFYSRMVGLEHVDLGAQFQSRGETFSVSGYRSRATKRPVLCTREKDGKSFAFTTDTIKSKFVPAEA